MAKKLSEDQIKWILSLDVSEAEEGYHKLRQEYSVNSRVVILKPLVRYLHQLTRDILLILTLKKYMQPL